MQTIYHLSDRECRDLYETLSYYVKVRGGHVTARVNTDHGAFKISVCHGIWSPPMGEAKPAE